MKGTRRKGVTVVAHRLLLAALDEVVGVSVVRGASVKPPGDIVTVNTLNRGADAVLRIAKAANEYGPVSVVTAEVASIIDSEAQMVVQRDFDEAIWEEMVAGLRHQGRVTANYVVLMALGGVSAAVGLVSEPVPQVTAFVAASIIAPAFEPSAKIPLGLTLRRWQVFRGGLVSVAIGYTVLILAAALTFLLLRALGATTVAALVENPEVERLAHPAVADLLVSVVGAVSALKQLLVHRRVPLL